MNNNEIIPEVRVVLKNRKSANANNMQIKHHFNLKTITTTGLYYYFEDAEIMKTERYVSLFYRNQVKIRAIQKKFVNHLNSLFVSV